MSEADAVKQTEGLPATVESLAEDLAALGVVSGSVVLIHASLSALGWVCGGAVAVVQALEKAVGPSGTLVMPTHSAELSEPSHWRHPQVPRDWWPIIRETMPPYDPAVTPTRGMGAIAECFRRQPGVLRSAHPHVSFAAHGPHAAEIASGHRLDEGFGASSPLGHLYDLEAWVLLLGVGHESNTSLHLAEVRALGDHGPRIETGAPVTIDGERQWVTFTEPDVDESDFPLIGSSFTDETGLVKSDRVGSGRALLMPQCVLVDFGERWIREHRKPAASG